MRLWLVLLAAALAVTCAALLSTLTAGGDRSSRPAGFDGIGETLLLPTGPCVAYAPLKEAPDCERFGSAVSQVLGGITKCLKKRPRLSPDATEEERAERVARCLPSYSVAQRRSVDPRG